MNARLQLRVQRYGCDRAVADYEPGWAAQIRPAQAALLDRARIAPGDRVLDVACGTGLVTLEAARLTGSAGWVLGTDVSEAMVEATQREAARAGLSHVDARRQDAEAPVDCEVPFDVALCALGLMYVPNPTLAVERMRQAVRPGGRVVAAVWGARGRCGWAEIFPIVDARVESDVCPMFFQLGTGDTLAHTFRTAGLEAVTTERLQVTLRYDSPDAALRAAFAGGPVALAYGRFDAPTRDGAHAEYLASIVAFNEGEGYAIPGEFVIGEGRRPA